MKQRLFISLLLIFSSPLLACPTCIGSGTNREAVAVRAGVLVLLGTLVGVFAGFAYFFRRVAARTRADLLRSESNR